MIGPFVKVGALPTVPRLLSADDIHRAARPCGAAPIDGGLPMPEGKGDPRSTARVLRELVAAFEDPGAAHPGLARRVREDARALLLAVQARSVAERLRLPTLMVPRSVVVEEPDPPPVPPAAL